MTPPDTIEALQIEVATLRARHRELKEAVDRMRRRSQRLERSIEVVPGAVWQSEGLPGTPAYQMPYVSGEVERIFGYTPSECLSRANFWTSITHPDDVPAVIRELAVVAERGGGRLSPIRFVAKDGRSVWVDTHITLYRNEGGEQTSRTVVAPDVTARVLSEQASAEFLARTQDLAQQLDNLIASVPGLVWEVAGSDASSLLLPIFLSDYLQTLIGYSPQEAVGKLRLWEEVTHPDDRDRVQSELQAIAGSGSGIVQCRWLTREGTTVWVETKIRMIRDESGVPFGAFCVTLDVTARKLFESERERLKEKVIAAQQALLTDLSTPIIPLSDEVTVIPLIGTIDAQRADRVIAALLDGAAKSRPKVAILDITGVRSVGAEAAAALLRAALGARLLGIEVVLTGIGPQAAAALAALKIDFAAITTCGTLESGIAYATRRR